MGEQMTKEELARFRRAADLWDSMNMAIYAPRLLANIATLESRVKVLEEALEEIETYPRPIIDPNTVIDVMQEIARKALKCE